MRNGANIFDLYRQVKLKESEILERTLTDAEKEKLKKLEKEVPMKDFKDRYGKEGESVYYATLTKMAKDEGFASDAQRRAAFAQGYKAKGKKGKKEETELDEAKFSNSMVDKLKKAYEPMRGKKINPTPLMKIFDKIDSNKEGLIQLYKADIPFVSMMAMSRLMLKHNMKADEINKLGKIRREDFVLDEAKYEVQYTVGSRVGDSRSRMKSRLSKIDIDAKSKEDAENKFFKQAEKSPMMKDAMRRDMLDVVYVGLKETLDEKFTKKDFAKNEDENRHTENAIELVKMFGTSAEDIKVNAIAARHNMKGSIDRKDQQNRDALIKNYYPKLKEEVELDEKYDLYHSTFSGAMQHAYDYAKSKLGVTVDPKEIDSKVATGPRKPTQGKTNTYRLKGKGGNLQIQVFNKGGSKPFELNMYKEEVELDEAMKYNFMVLDPDGKVMGMTSSEKNANDMAKPTGNLLKLRGRVVKLRRPMATTRGDRMLGMLPADNLGEGTDPIKEMIESGNFTRTEIKNMIKRRMLDEASLDEVIPKHSVRISSKW